MNKLQTIVLTGSIFGLVALGLAIPSVWPEARANEASPEPQSNPVADIAAGAPTLFTPAAPSMDTTGLVKFGYNVDPSVSTKPVRQSTVTKIAGGVVTTVQVVETTSGVYSSDAMDDPHVLYPGIHRVPEPANPTGFLLLDAAGWSSIVPVNAKSFVSIHRLEGGGQVVVTDDSICTYTRHGVSC